MSSLWTPDGEREVSTGHRAAPPGPVHDDEHDRDDREDDREDDHQDVADEHDETARAVAEELAGARQRLAEVPAEGVVANHAMGLFELGAIHLSSGPGHLPEAALAIDAMGALVEGLEGRLGENEPVLRDALSQIRLAFVQVKASVAAG